jgi:hypothetical protein
MRKRAFSLCHICGSSFFSVQLYSVSKCCIFFQEIALFHFSISLIYPVVVAIAELMYLGRHVSVHINSEYCDFVNWFLGRTSILARLLSSDRCFGHGSWEGPRASRSSVNFLRAGTLLMDIQRQTFTVTSALASNCSAQQSGQIPFLTFAPSLLRGTARHIITFLMTLSKPQPTISKRRTSSCHP